MYQQLDKFVQIKNLHISSLGGAKPLAGGLLCPQYPFLPDDGTPDMGRRQQISQHVAVSEDGVMIVAHSFGASMLLAYFSEFKVKRKVAGIFFDNLPASS
ncbi:alpha/beta hydrolase [Dyadobacter sp. SG02]|uniref:alpha/beta hydrolase n=1 Tax=Dyadobacter sp. SG02 TaxID=1855291 RepID=UPI000B88CAA2|nr:alpha/beta hydrolase [Dyadobacter sp. SG02]